MAAAGIELPLGCEIEDALMVGDGGSDPMDFHALEGMQCMVERRRGGETGVKAVQLIQAMRCGKPATRAASRRNCSTAALSRSDTPLGPDGRRTAARRIWSASGELPKLVKNPAAYFIEYRDGLQGDHADAEWRDQGFQFRRAGERQPQESWSTQFLLTPEPNVTYSACLMHKARADVRDRRGAVSGRAHAAGQRHAGELSDVEGAGPHTSGDAAFVGSLHRAPRTPARLTSYIKR